MAGTPQHPVKGHGAVPIDVMHDLRKGRAVRQAEHQVDVVGHDCVSIQGKPVSLLVARQDPSVQAGDAGIPEQESSIVAPDGHMVSQAGF
jgi:hypothetical protein